MSEKPQATIYVVMVNDRHVDPEPYVFSKPEVAIDHARRLAHEYAHTPENVEEHTIQGWLYYAAYSPEGDAVWVIEKIVDRPAG